MQIKVAALVCTSLLIVSIASQSSSEADDGKLLQPWVKKGVIIPPGFTGSTSMIRVSAPFVVKLSNDRLRMYFWTSGEGGIYIYAAEADIKTPESWRLVSEKPMLGPNPSSDIRDVGPGYPWVVPRDDAPWLMYFCSWGSWAKPGESSNRTSLAISHDEGITWEVIKEPLLPLGPVGSHDAGITGSVCVLRTAPDEYKMWYTGGHYVDIDDTHRLIVHIGYATSRDGIEWKRYPNAVLSPRCDAVDPYEVVVSKPSVVIVDGTYHMWFSFYPIDGRGYRLNYARSVDGIHWDRKPDDLILPLSKEGYDTKNHSYPCVIEVGDEFWMFHVGNSFGATGIALATMKKSALE